jgi:lipopolysaccharide export system protein LptC
MTGGKTLAMTAASGDSGSFDARPRSAGRQPPRLSGRNGYSLFVGVLKVLLPALAAGLVLLVIAWPQLRPLEDSVDIGISELSLDQADNLTMLNARYQGRDDKDQLFNLTADKASQATGGDDLIELEQPKADLFTTDGAWLAVTAASGQYRRRANMLDLAGAVSLYHDDGFEMHTDSAHVDLEAGTATGSDPVQGQGPFGLLNAEGFSVVDRGQRVIFFGKSRLIIFQGAKETL